MAEQMQNVTPVLEVCVDDLAGMSAAIAGGADRIELCAALACGGLTPTLGFMQLAAQCPIPVYAMIRPRSGSFVFSEAEVALMINDIAAARNTGLAGVVLGASLADGRLDCDVLRELIAEAGEMDVTLHRAFDLVPDRLQALLQAQALGFRRILTSGGQKSAPAGIDALSELVAEASGRLSIMPGGGVTADNLECFAALGITEFHASCSTTVAASATLVDFGFETAARRQTDESSVRRMKQRLLSLTNG